MSRRRNTSSGDLDDDFYSILGIAKNSTEADIKRAYKKLALRHHPDKNPENPADAEIQFKRVTRAYEVLGCADTRARYDRYGVAGLEGGDASSKSTSSPAAAATSGGRHHFTSTMGGHHPFQGFPLGGGGGLNGFAFHDPFEVFRSVFGDSDPFADMMDRHRQHHHRHAADHHKHHHDAHRDNQERHQQKQQQQQQAAHGAHGHPADPFRSNNNATSQRGGEAPRSRMMPPSSLFDHMMGGGFMGGGGFGGSMFNDDFFGGGGMMSGFGDMSHGMSRQLGGSSMRGATGGGCVSTSQSVSTVIRNGRRVTRTVIRKTDANGVTTEDVDEEIEDIGSNRAPQRHHHQSSIRGNGGGQHQSIQFMF